MTIENPIIHYDNKLESGITTVTSENPGNPIGNIFDFQTGTYWIPTSNADQEIIVDMGVAKKVNAFAITDFDLGTQTATVEVFSDDNIGFTTPTSLGIKAFTSNDPFYMDLTEANERFIKIKITLLTAPCFIAVLFVGEKLKMETGRHQESDEDAQESHGESFRSIRGQFINSSKLFDERQVNDTFTFLSQTFVTDELLPFLNNHYMNLLPFFYIPDIGTYPKRAYFIYPPLRPRIRLPRRRGFLQREWTLIAQGVKESDFV